MLALVLTLALAQPAPAPKPSLLKPMIALTACSVGDAWTTAWNVNHGYKDFNLLFDPTPSTAKVILSKAAFTAGWSVIAHFWNKKPDPWPGNARTLLQYGAFASCTNATLNLLIQHEGIRR